MPSESPEDNQAEANDQAKPVTEGLACNGCRKAKLRCSRDRPNCLHCRKTGLDCIYESKRIKPGLKSGAVENLHRRLDEIEHRLAKGDVESTKRSRNDVDASTANVGGGGDSVAQSILALLARELPKLVTQGQNESTPTSESSFQTCKRRREDDALDITSRMDDAPSLPTADILEPILTAYFTHVHPWIPMIHQSRFFERVADETQREQLLIVIHSMVLAAYKFVPGAGIYIRAQTRNWIICSAMGSLKLEHLQALIILAFNDFGDGNAEKAWSIIGSMTRTVEYMQLAQEQEEGEQRPFSQPFAPLQYAVHWTEVEERRRVFWNVFLLDRLCSVTQGWNTSLTSDDVFRRLPCDGYLWRKEEPVSTPYFGIWDKSKGRIGNPIDFMSRHPSPGHGSSNVKFHDTIGDPPTSAPYPQYQHSDMSTVGAFAYNIEATESMSRVMSYFLQQKVNVRDQGDISSWLTRFKELDLRLVHWKMLLPQKWKANPNLTRQVPLMDPNLTTAHITHNASMILLHQTIAYPPLHWGFRNRLPSGCSAEACYLAGVEIATITQKYLSKSLSNSPIGSQYAFCIFIAARVLLVHWRYETEDQLPAEFWSLVHSLDEMSLRWRASAQVSSQTQNLFGKYASRLKELYDKCSTDPNYRIDVMNYTSDIQDRHPDSDSVFGYSLWPVAPQPVTHLIPEGTAILPSNAPESMDFTSIPSLDQSFVDLDRVIAFDDGSMFTAAFDAAAVGW
ncbi:fungal-specific transcription factor domain-containing protein [Boeremia exigua]|uniref:fungal-specific transcription factor domain-containing protein n=1 Tax=Boeremia exigua TaxID=749465 RepID=UPI001E8DC6A7|nr:fungal-specific transcription factor domain-containing protein [Boeremia exigua]KAH6611852.1 fungal-specific transcription factor domain-containing protein [Boeremia exigua]